MIKKVIASALLLLAGGCCIIGRIYEPGIYPGTKATWELVSFPFVEHSDANGDYMLYPFVIISYPFALVGVPVQAVLDTVILPYDYIRYRCYLKSHAHEILLEQVWQYTYLLQQGKTEEAAAFLKKHPQIKTELPDRMIPAE